MAKSADKTAEAEQAARDAEFAQRLAEAGELVVVGKLYVAPPAPVADPDQEEKAPDA